MKYDKVAVFQQSKMKVLEHPLAVVVRIRNTNTALDRSVAFCFILDQEELYEKLFQGISEENSMAVCRPDGTLLCGFGSHAEELAGWAASQELAGTDIMNRTGKKDQAVSIGWVSCYVRSAFETVNGNRIFITAASGKSGGTVCGNWHQSGGNGLFKLPEIYVHAGYFE